MDKLKGQSAIEYLMTYGWMLLVVALVGGLLFALFQDQELESQSVDGFEGSDVRVEEVTASNGSVQLSLSSYSSEDMESVSICLNNSELGGVCSKEFSLDRLSDRVVDLNGFNESGETYIYDVSVSYETTGGISDTVSGSVSLALKPGTGDDSNEESPSESVSISVRNTGDNATSSVSPGDSVKIYGEFNSTGSSLDSGWLATNETGTWENKTSKYFNDSLGGEDVWVWNNFTWSNSSVSSEEVGWRLYANNSDGTVESSSKKSFKVGSGVSAPGVEVLEPVGVNGSNATLRGNVTDLGDASSVDVSFNVTSNSSIGFVDSDDSFGSTGVFEEDVTGLEASTGYNFTAWAENSAGLNTSDKQNFTTDYRASEADSKLKHRWLLSEESGPFEDVVGNDDATNQGAQRVQGSYVGGSARKGDGSSQYIETSKWGNFGSNMDTDFAIAFTLKANSTGNILGTYGGDNPADLYINVYNDGDLGFYIRDSNYNAERVITDGANVMDLEKRRIVMNKKGNDASNMEIWINGVKQNVVIERSQGFASASVNNFDYPVAILGKTNDGDGSVGAHINATIDDVSVFKEDLSEQEIKSYDLP
jgi:hypothetical protein